MAILLKRMESYYLNNKMKEKFIIAISFILSSFIVSSQKLVISFESGVGTYSMKNLKLVNNSASTAVPFETKLVDDFPPYFYFRPSVTLKFNSHNIGLVYNMQSSGARITSKDYSGEYVLDMKVKSNSIGILNEFDTNKGKSILSFYTIAGMNFSEINLVENLTVFDQKAPSEEVNLPSNSYFIEAGIKPKFTFNKLALGLNLGYNYQFKNKKELTPEWNGVRVGLFINYIFGKREK